MHDALYQARILDHAKNPRNKRKLLQADVTIKGSNPSCGDTLVLYLRFNGDTIAEAAFEGEGCAISQATASLLTEKLVGLSKKQAQSLGEPDIYALLGVEVSIGRQKCALLAWRALQDILKKTQ
ncbi:MAG: SUF system NifU family Fe-S cluster assembly protein [Candidatus Pacebacteria bacterium]|nr:SUF system NifU family Fe-S cluster assembly protein [Candidatus Paceibacterota bacterium]